MLLSKETVANIQAKIEKSNFSVKEIGVNAIYSSSKLTVARYTLDGEEVVSQLHPQPNVNLADLIIDAAAFSDYYRLSEVYSGLEKDEVAEFVLKQWPGENTENVLIFNSKEKVPFGRDSVPSQEKMNQLAERFNGKKFRGRK